MQAQDVGRPVPASARARFGGRARVGRILAAGVLLTVLGALAPATASAVPHACLQPAAFVAQDSPTNLFRQVQGAGSTTFDQIGNNTTFTYNAIGFSPVDRFIYGVSSSPNDHLLRIHEDGSIEDRGAIVGLPDLPYNIGTFGNDDYYIASSGESPAGAINLYRVNVVAGTPTVTAVLPLSQGFVGADLTFAFGFIWGVQTADGRVVRINLSTGQVDKFPQGLIPAGPYGAAWTYGNGNIGISNNATGDVHQIRVVNPASASPTFQLVSTTGGPASGNNDGTACIPLPTDLALTKSSPATADPGSVVEWLITVTNNGPGVSSGFTATDTLPAGVSNVSSPTAGCSVSGRSVTCVLGGLAVGASTTIRVRAQMPATYSTPVANSASVTPNEQDPTPGNNSATSTTTTRAQRADVRVVKTADRFDVPLQDTVVFTVVATNDGPDPANDVVVTDLPGWGLTPVSASGPSPCSTATRCAVGTIPAGESRTVRFTMRGTTTGRVGNAASATSPTNDPNVSNNTSSTEVDVHPSADLSLSKTSSDSSVSEGEDFTYTVTVRNAGPSTAEDVTVTDAVPANVRLRSADPSQGGCAGSGTVTCVLGSIPSGGTATIALRVTATDAGTTANSAIVSSPTYDPDPADNMDSSTVATDRRADLEVVKTGPADGVAVGESYDYVIKVTNRGPSRALGTAVTDTPPDGTTVVGVRTTDGGCLVTRTVVCNLGAIAARDTVTITITVRATAPGQKYNTATAISEVPDPDPGDNTSQTSTSVTSRADLDVTKQASAASVAAGDTVSYDIVVSNAGPSDASSVAVTDPIPAGAAVVSVTPSAGRCETGGGVLVCDLGTLANGSRVTIRLELRFTQAGMARNTVQVTSPTPDPDLADNQAGTETTAERADLSITKTGPDGTIPVGDTTAFTITARNNGPTVARGVVVTDTLPVSLRFVSARASAGSCATVAGILACELSDLAAGASATVTVTARVLGPGTSANTASVVSRFPTDASPVNNVASAEAAGDGRLRVRKTGSRRTADAGDRVPYTITVTNRSTLTLPNVRVCDRLPSGLTLVSASTGGRLSEGRVCWTLGSLRGRGSRSVTVVTRAARGASGRVVNVATASSPGSRRRSAVRGLQIRGGDTRTGGVTG